MKSLQHILILVIPLSCVLLSQCRLDISAPPTQAMYINLLNYPGLLLPEPEPGQEPTPEDSPTVTLAGSLTTGAIHTCVRLETGKVRCWGLATVGRLGYGATDNIGDDEDPASAGDVNMGGDVIQISALAAHTCAIMDTKKLRCWGWGPFGRLGYGNTSNVSIPAVAGDVNVGGDIKQAAAGDEHSCILLDSGAVRCFGRGFQGSLGYGNRNSVGDDEDPISVGDVSVGNAASRITAGNGHTCALLVTGKVRCWGSGYQGTLGYGNQFNIGDDEIPSTQGEVALGGTVIEISAGSNHTCALMDDRTVRCWGSNEYGQLGYGNTEHIGDNETPLGAGTVDVGGNVTQISAGWQHTCALLDTGAVRCWGNGQNGRLGYGNTDSIGDNETPSTAGDVNLGGNATALSAGGLHTCALLTGGTVRCWGQGSSGQLGYGNTESIGDNEDPADAGDVNVGGLVRN